jgi:hypothetical protein
MIQFLQSGSFGGRSWDVIISESLRKTEYKDMNESM